MKKSLALLSALAVIGFANYAYAAISVDSQAATTSASASSLTFTHTLTALSNTELSFCVNGRGSGKTISSLTVNGSNATQEASTSVRSSTVTVLSNIWDFPATQTVNQITITGSGIFSTGISATSTAFNGVNSTTPRDGAASTTNSGTQTGINAGITTTVSGDYFMDCLQNGSATVNPTAGTSQTGSSRLNPSTVGFEGTSYKAATTTGAQSMFWTWSSGSTDTAFTDVAYQPQPTAGENTQGWDLFE